jgi:hypothetical protein
LFCNLQKRKNRAISVDIYWQECKEQGRYMYSVPKNQNVLLNETGSKWAFLYPNGKIFNIGAGVMQDSNTGFLPTLGATGIRARINV